MHLCVQVLLGLHDLASFEIGQDAKWTAKIENGTIACSATGENGIRTLYSIALSTAILIKDDAKYYRNRDHLSESSEKERHGH